MQGSAIFNSSPPLLPCSGRKLRGSQSLSTCHPCYKNCLTEEVSVKKMGYQHAKEPYQQILNTPGGSRLPPVKASKAPSLKSWGRDCQRNPIFRKRMLIPRWFSSHEGQVSRTVATTTFPTPLLLLPPPWFVIRIWRPQYAGGYALPCQ